MRGSAVSAVILGLPATHVSPGVRVWELVDMNLPVIEVLLML